ncbi:Glutaredoxin-1 [Smittium culicis]|uniref:Glutaredoxin-1 n=1 Tax=Smittium culicis TaxID=133412 RepID=A0A1R1XZ20_9FUNG|nr:Glutaredoxin-1 [Smittium culicis]OMJ19868.1 Glutaredoxin-1 [Smittium culicis]
MFRLKRSTKILLNRIALISVIVFVFYQARFYFFGSIHQENQAFESQSPALADISKNILLEYPNIIKPDQIILLSTSDSSQAEKIESYLKADPSFRIPYTKHDFTDYYLSHLLRKDTQQSFKTILFVNQVPLTFDQLDKLSNAEIRKKISKIMPSLLKNNPNKKRLSELEYSIDKKLSDAVSSNLILGIYLKSHPSFASDFDKICSQITKKYLINCSSFHIDPTSSSSPSNSDSNLKNLNSATFGSYDSPSIFFQNKFYSISEFSSLFNSGKFDSIFAEIRDKTTSESTKNFLNLLSENKVVLFLNPQISESMNIFKIFENYKNKLGLSYKPVWVSNSDFEYSLIKSKLPKSALTSKSHFPCIFLDGEFFADYSSFFKLFISGSLFDTFEKSSLLSSELVSKSIQDASQSINSLTKNNKYLILSTSDSSLTPKIRSAIRLLDPTETVEVYNVDEDSYDITIVKRAFEKKYINIHFPALFESTKIVAMGNDILSSLLSSNNLKSVLKELPQSTEHNKDSLISLINSHKAIMFSKTYCPFCRGAKALLDKYNVKYFVLEVNMEPNPLEIKDYLTEITKGHSSFPSIFINKVSIGGLSDLKEIEQSGKLAKLIDEFNLTQ